MKGIVCDRCDRSLLVHEDVRYEVLIRVTAAYDPLELSADALKGAADLDDEIRRLTRAVEGRTAEDLEAEVFKEFRFDLCLRCQREYLQAPLPPRRPEA